MYLEPMYCRNRDGSVRGPYFREVTSRDGVRRRRYVRQEHVHKAEGLKGLLRGIRPDALPPIPRLSKPNGRPPKVSVAVRDLYRAAGYRVRGDRLLDKRNVHLDTDAMEVRFALLSEEYQARIGNPKHLQDLYHRAQCRLRSAQRRRQRGYGLAQAFEDVLVEAEHADGPVH